MALPRAARIACVTLVAAASMAGCGSSSAPRAGASEVVGINEHDFHIQAPSTVAPGTVTIRVHNSGPDMHELFVVRTEATALPLRTDGLTVDEDRIKPETTGSIDGIPPGSTKDTRIHLTPGRYLLFCNMAGHFRGGMHTQLVVT
jgi:uncharacterized cupredoxin-like copper-binding protein